MNNKRWLAVAALVAGGAVMTMRGGCLDSSTKAPDELLAVRFEEMCAIARANISTPERGVRKLGHYLGKHAGDITGDWGATLAAIERIDDDRKHDDRARLARDRIRTPLRACERDWVRFGNAVEADPKAKALVDRFSIRFNRTIEIIFSGAKLDLLTLPSTLGDAIDQLR